FYVPETWWPSRLPSSSREYWQWVLGEAAVNGPIQRWTGARHASTVRTYLQLREAGVPCEITNVWPTQGIVITHTDFLPHKGGDRFMNVAYFGIEGELDPSLRDEQWQARLRDLGFDFTIRHPETWHDYRDVDVIVAARSFDYPGGWLLKPASKLLNAWRAGVP